MMKSGDCVIKHPGVFTTGLKLVVGEKFMCYLLGLIFLCPS